MVPFALALVIVFCVLMIIGTLCSEKPHDLSASRRTIHEVIDAIPEWELLDSAVAQLSPDKQYAAQQELEEQMNLALELRDKFLDLENGRPYRDGRHTYVAPRHAAKWHKLVEALTSEVDELNRLLDEIEQEGHDRAVAQAEVNLGECAKEVVGLQNLLAMATCGSAGPAPTHATDALKRAVNRLQDTLQLTGQRLRHNVIDPRHAENICEGVQRAIAELEDSLQPVRYYMRLKIANALAALEESDAKLRKMAPVFRRHNASIARTAKAKRSEINTLRWMLAESKTPFAFSEAIARVASLVTSVELDLKPHAGVYTMDEYKARGRAISQCGAMKRLLASATK